MIESAIHQLRMHQAAAVLVVLFAVAAFLATVWWVARPGHESRWITFAAANLWTALVAVVYLVAVLAGWWQGPFFEIPLLVQLALLLPLATVVWAAWITGYRWLASRTRYAMVLYAQLTLVLLGLVVVADNLEISGGQVLLGDNRTVWLDALIGFVLLWIPIFVYEGMRRVLAHLDPLP